MLLFDQPSFTINLFSFDKNSRTIIKTILDEDQSFYEHFWQALDVPNIVLQELETWSKDLNYSDLLDFYIKILICNE